MDLKSALATGLVFGVVIGLVIGAALVWLRSSTVYWLVVGPVLGVPLGIGAGLVHSRVWATVIAQTCLFATDRTPLRLVHFLEDARSRKLLRTLGSSYQFRHNLLHIRLREKTSSTTADR